MAAAHDPESNSPELERLAATASSVTTSPLDSRRFAAFLLLALLPILPVVLGRGFLVLHDVFLSDLLHSHFPFRAFLGRELARGHFPLWMPDIYGGVPFLASIETAALYPPNLLFFGLLDPYVALNVTLVFHVLLGATGLYVLARELGVSRAGAALGGLVFALAGFNVSHMRHPTIHADAALLPWQLFALERLVRSAGSTGAVSFALLIALSWLAGHPQITYISLLFLGARAAVGIARIACGARDPLRALRCALAAGGAVAIGTALTAVILVPGARITSASLGETTATWAYASGFPFRLRDLLGFVYPAAVGSLEAGTNQSIIWENYGYVGLLPLLLLVPGLISRGRTRPVFYGAATAVALVLVVGPATPVYRLAWSLVPGMKLFRFPTRFLVVASVGLATIAAAGLDEAVRRLASAGITARSQALLAAAAIVVAFADLALHQRERLPIDDLESWRKTSRVAEAIHARGVPGRIYTFNHLNLWKWAYLASPDMRAHPDAYRLAWELPLANDVVLRGLTNVQGYCKMVGRRCAAFWQDYGTELLSERFQPPTHDSATGRIPPEFRSLLDRAQARYLVSSFPVEGDDIHEIWKGFVHVYENASALPRAYVATRWRPVADLAGAAAWMLEDGASAIAVPSIEGVAPRAPTAESVAGTILAAVVRDPSPNRVEIDVAEGPGGMLVLGDTFDEGWSATVDGRAAPVLIANGYQRAVAIDPGAHRVVFDYWPSGLTEGLSISAGAATILAAWAAFAWARRRRPL